MDSHLPQHLFFLKQRSVTQKDYYKQAIGGGIFSLSPRLQDSAVWRLPGSHTANGRVHPSYKCHARSSPALQQLVFLGNNKRAVLSSDMGWIKVKGEHLCKAHLALGTAIHIILSALSAACDAVGSLCLLLF